MRALFGQRKGLPYRTLALCLTAFVIVANVSFWVFTNSQPEDERHKLLLKSSGSKHHLFNTAPRFEYVKLTEDTRSASRILTLPENGGLSKGNRTENESLSALIKIWTYGKEAIEGQNVLIYPTMLRASPREVSELDGRVITNTVHYVWCGNSTFEYRHFLSVMSVWRELEPDAIEFKYETLPREDKYNTWFTYIRTHLPVFHASPLPEWVKGDQCGDAHALETLSDRGGVFVGAGVVMGSKAARELLYKRFTVAFNNDMSIGLASGTARDKIFRVLIDHVTHYNSKKANSSVLRQVPRHVKTAGSGDDPQVLNEWMVKSRQIVNDILTSFNQSKRIFFCANTEMIKDLDQSLKRPVIPDVLYEADMGNGNFCVNVDRRLQPRQVIEGHKQNPLASVLYRHVYNEEIPNTNASRTTRPANTRSSVVLQKVHADPSNGKPVLSNLSNKYSDSSSNKERAADIEKNPALSRNSTLYIANESNLTIQMTNHSTSVKSLTGMNIPRLAHYVWFGMKNMTFGMYLSFLSSVHVLKPDRILIHGDGRLQGEFWDKVRKHPLVTLVFRDPPISIFSKAVVYTSHRSDVVRADVLDKYGGVYMDWDAYWLTSPERYFAPKASSFSLTGPQENAESKERNRHSKMQTNASSDLINMTDNVNKMKNPATSNRHDMRDLKSQTMLTEADAVVSRDHIPRPPFPDTINMGVVLARPRSKFIQAWRAALVDYRSRDFLYNAVELPYKIYEMFPRSVVIDDRLQVMCYHLLCHPSYHPDFKKWNKAQPFNWTSDGIHAIHFTHPDPPAFHNLTSLLQATGTFADIGRYIWGLQSKKDMADFTGLRLV